MSDDTHLSPAERLRGQRAALRTNLVAQAAQFIVIGQIMVLYASDVLGYDAARIGTIMALSPLLVLVRLPLLAPIRRFGRVRTLLLADLLRFAVVLALLVIPAERLGFLGYLGLLIAFSAGVQTLKGAVWQSLMRDITTGADRGRFFASMRFWFFTVTSGCTAATAWLIGDQLDEWEYKILLGFVLLGLANHCFWGQRIPDRVAEETGESSRPRRRLWQVARTAPILRRPLAISLLLHLLTLPVVIIYLRQALQVPADLVSTFLFVQTVSAALAFLFWGRIADAIGFRALLLGLLLLQGLSLFLLFLVQPFSGAFSWWSPQPEALLSAVALLVWGAALGFTSSGVGIATTALQHAHVDADDSLESLGLFSAIDVAVTAAITFGAGWFLQMLVVPTSAWDWQQDFLHVDLFKIYLLAVTWLLGPVIGLLLLGLPNPRLGFGLGDFFSSLIVHPISSLRRSGRVFHEDESERQALAHWVGQHRNPVLIEPLITLLDDPSYDVRLEATRALARVQAPRAVAVLLAHLHDPSRRQLWEHTAWALGELGAVEALPRLQACCEPDMPTRIQAMAVRALGKLGDPAAVPTIRGLLQAGVHSRHLQGSCCRALLRLGAHEAIAEILTVFAAFEDRFDRYELATELCLWLGLSSRWLLRGDPDKSLHQHLSHWLTFREPAWRAARQPIIDAFVAVDHHALAAQVQAHPQAVADGHLQAVVDHLRERERWSPVAVLAAAWLLQRPVASAS